MVNATKVETEYWFCKECLTHYDFKDDAEECCKKDGK